MYMVCFHLDKKKILNTHAHAYTYTCFPVCAFTISKPKRPVEVVA